MAAPQEAQHIWPSVLLLVMDPKELKTGTQIDGYTLIFIAHYSQQLKGKNNPSVYQQINELRKCSISRQWNIIQYKEEWSYDMLTTWTWTNFENIRLSEINQTQKDKYMIPLTWNIYNDQIHRNRK